MSVFRTGEFNRDALHGFFRPFCPARAMHSVKEIDLDGLKLRGKKLILIDVDNTIVHWRSHDFEDEVIQWLDKAKSLGFHLAILSNTRKPERLKKLAAQLEIPVMAGKFKPSREMFVAALERFKVEPMEAVMVGDQIFTDILGANRSGIEAIWVKQMSPKDFIGTKVSRMGERFLRSRLYRALVDVETPLDPLEADNMPNPGQTSLMKQILRFVVVGGSSFIIDTGILFMLMFVAKSNGHLWSESIGSWLIQHFPNQFGQSTRISDPAIWVFKPISAGVAILNSFVWNRRWTFDIKGKEDRALQLRRFYIISFGGYIISNLLTNMLNSIVPGHRVRGLFIAQVIAAFVAAIWNFAGYRFYTFKTEKK